MLLEEDEKLPNGSGEDVASGAEDYVSAIKDLKQNYVPKAELEKLKADNKTLKDALYNGLEAPKEEVKEVIDVNECRRKLFKGEFKNDLEFTENALKLRKGVIESGGLDPFVTKPHNGTITQEDLEKAKKVANILQSCVDYAEGDPALFHSELDRDLAKGLHNC